MQTEFGRINFAETSHLQPRCENSLPRLDFLLSLFPPNAPG
jgi:hypothetical protein